MKFYGVKIAGTGAFAPEKILTNHDLEKIVDTSDEWITSRTGIKERHQAAENETTSDMGTEAALKALKSANISAEEVDLLICATLSPDTIFPNTACHIQRKIGASNAACFSIEAACSGFIYALKSASDMIRCGSFKNVLIVCSEKMTSLLDWEDRTTCILFGDGAGAAVLQPTEPENNSILASKIGANGNFANLLNIPAGGCAMPLTHELLDQRENKIKMAGREIFKLAVNAMVGSSEDVLKEAGITIDQVRWLVPHQANTRIILAVGKRLRIPQERVYINVDRFGNTSAASIPIAFAEICQNDQIKRGDYILFTAFGAGLTWGSQLIRW